MPTLQKRFVDGAGPGRHYDDRLPGFGLYVGGKGARSYFVEYRPGRGRALAKRRFTFARHGAPRLDGGSWTPDLAREHAMRLLGRIKDGHDPLAERENAERLKADTVAGAVELWLARDQGGNRTVAEVRRLFENDVLPAWGKRPMADIRKRDVIDLVDRIHSRAPVRANRLLAHLRRFFNWSCGRDMLEANPAAYVEKPAPESRRDRLLSDTELVTIWHAADAVGGPFGAGVKLLMLTGARREEVFRVTRDELNVVEGCIRLPAARSKSGEARTIWLSEPALEIMRGLPTFAGSPWLLSTSGEKPYSNFGFAKSRLDAVIAAGRLSAATKEKSKHMPEWRLHDLRRTIATGLQKLGTKLEVIEEVLGHVSGSRAGIVGIYQRHRFDDEARAALAVWGEHVRALVEGRTTDKVVPLRRPA
jgi:site-specific recombinase XerD